MPNAIKTFVRYVDAFNLRVGRISMYLIFAMMGILLWSSFSKVFLLPSLWTLEMAQFTLTAYYLIGGPYAMQLGGHVRMDLFYGSWTERQKALADALTSICLIFYLGVLLFGGVESTIYALEYGERSYSVWRPYMAPIKIVMCIGIVLMLLQSLVVLARDIATLRGEEL